MSFIAKARLVVPGPDGRPLKLPMSNKDMDALASADHAWWMSHQCRLVQRNDEPPVAAGAPAVKAAPPPAPPPTTRTTGSASRSPEMPDVAGGEAG